MGINSAAQGEEYTYWFAPAIRIQVKRYSLAATKWSWKILKDMQSGEKKVSVCWSFA